MVQLLDMINTLKYSQNYYANKEIDKTQYVLIDENIVFPDFKNFIEYKDLVLDLLRKVNSLFIKDVMLLEVENGKVFDLVNDYKEKFLIVFIENTINIEFDNKNIPISCGSVLFSNEDYIKIINTTLNSSLLLLIKYEELKLC